MISHFMFRDNAVETEGIRLNILYEVAIDLNAFWNSNTMRVNVMDVWPR